MKFYERRANADEVRVGVGAANASPVAVRRWNMTGKKKIWRTVSSAPFSNARKGIHNSIYQYREGTGTEGSIDPRNYSKSTRFRLANKEKEELVLAPMEYARVVPNYSSSSQFWF
jgi:hypothetical protein